MSADLHIGVIGAGTMGVGIAIAALRGGHSVVLNEVDAARAERGVASVRRFLDRSVELGKLEPSERDAAVARLTSTSALSGLGDCDVVVEAIYEDEDLKADTFRALEDICREDTLFHTNTSTLSVAGIAARCAHPERVVGTHYCNPAPLMDLVEVVRGHRTSDDAFERTQAFIRGLGKRPVVTQDRPGFLVNRFLVPFENDCVRALDAGLGTVESIDAAVKKGLGHPMGPFTLLDIVGLDIHRAVSMSLYERLRDPRFAPPPLVDRMISANTLGRKTGEGFYRYADARLMGT